MTTILIDPLTREQVRAFLPIAITRTLNSYKQFMEKAELTTDHNAKEFSAHHAACKTAISHLELLLKLAQWANLDRKNITTSDDCEFMIEQAISNIQAFENKEKN